MLDEITEKLRARKACLVAVSKTKPNEAIQNLYDLGQRDFGENRVAELVEKQATLPKDIRWHMIGHLQTKKVKSLAHFVHLIHSVDSLKLLHEIQKHAAKHGRTIDVLIQIKIGSEISKFGLDGPSEIDGFFSEVTGPNQGNFDNVRIRGLMGMASFVSDEEVVRSEFRELQQHFNRIKQQYFAENEEFSELSMGMSGDFEIALEEGSTIVRIGSLLFGPRN